MELQLKDLPVGLLPLNSTTLCDILLIRAIASSIVLDPVLVNNRPTPPRNETEIRFNNATLQSIQV